MRAGPTDGLSRARPVADAPVDDLVAGAEEVAKAWVLELVAATPLSAAGELPLGELAREAPTLCAAVARALADDRALARLQPGGDLCERAARAGALAGGPDPASVAAAVEALRRAVWDFALGSLPRPPAALVADLAERLSAVCAAVAAAALAVPPAEKTGTEPFFSADVDRLADLARAAAEEAVQAADLRGQAAPLVRPPMAGEEDEQPGAVPRVTDGDPRTHLAARAAEFVADGRPFAVLLVELDGVDALLAARRDGEVDAAIAAAEAALEDLVRPGDAIRREGPGRVWLTLPGAGPAGARALALRAAAAVERAAGHRGRPLTATVGVAVCPRDGADGDALAERAEDDLVAAQAAGTHGAPPPVL